MATLEIDYATPYETGPKQLHDIGQRAETPNGDVFRYVKMGAAVGVANKLYQGSIAVANWNTQAHTVSIAIGDTEISFTSGGGSIAAGEAEGGTIIVELGTDLGHIYRVKSNLATAANETVCQLEDGVTVQVASATGGSRVLTFAKSPYMDILIHPATTPTAVVVGVPRVIIAIAGWGWVQRRGVTSILSTGTPLVGQKVIPGTSVGSVIEGASQSANIKSYIGTTMQAATATEFGHFFINLE
ncbi:hypothetical protein LCGC14_1430870 [marine sediment metagenome]|uniref:Uncharacterized protein n=1 Tax=marine sediment metagenome TaxID=412755 RepID=A0A0F9K9T8_9ZZZZ